MYSPYFDLFSQMNGLQTLRYVIVDLDARRKSSGISLALIMSPAPLIVPVSPGIPHESPDRLCQKMVTAQ